MSTQGWAVALHNKAVAAGKAACAAARTTPMNITDGAQDFHVPDGPCGFAWVHLTCKGEQNRNFITGLKAAGLAGSDCNTNWRHLSEPGFKFWVGDGGQSIQRKEAFAEAMAAVLEAEGITAYAGSRLD